MALLDENLSNEPQNTWTSPTQEGLSSNPTNSSNNLVIKKIIFILVLIFLMLVLMVGGYFLYKKTFKSISNSNNQATNTIGYLKLKNVKNYYVGESSNTDTVIAGELYNESSQAMAPFRGNLVVSYDAKSDQTQSEEWAFSTSKETIMPGEKAFFVATPPRIKKVTIKSYTIELEDTGNKQTIKSEAAENSNFLAYKVSESSFSCQPTKNDFSYTLRPTTYTMNGAEYSNLLMELTYTGEEFINFSDKGECSRHFPLNAKVVEFNNKGQVSKMYLQSFGDNPDGSLKNTDGNYSFEQNEKINKGDKFYGSLSSVAIDKMYGKDFIVEFIY